MTKNAFNIICENGRNVLKHEWLGQFDVSHHSESIARWLARDEDVTGLFEALDRNAYLTGNSLAVLKLTTSVGTSFHVKAVRAPDSESVYLATVVDRYPSLTDDQSVLVPTVVDVVDTTTNQVVQYIHVSRWQKSDCTLAGLLIRLWFEKRVDALEGVLSSFGQFLKGFHMKYPKLMHNDMTPSNVLIVGTEKGNSFVLADCAGLDDEVGDDVKSFIASLQVLADGGFGDEFLSLSTLAFLRGYNSL